MGQAGRLDSSFAGKGWLTTRFLIGNKNEERGLGIMLKPDGSMIVLTEGTTAPPYSTKTSFLVRFSADGKQDLNFGVDGFSQQVNLIHSTAVQLQDGKIIVAGALTDDGAFNGHLAFARYFEDGDLDTSFGSNGILNTKRQIDEPSAVVLQPDQKILVAGTTYDNEIEQYGFALARFSPTGIPDSSWGDAGIATTFFNTNHPEILGGKASSLALQTDGKVVVAGSILNGLLPSKDFALVRYKSDGSLDSGFATNGIQVTDFTGGEDEASSVVVQQDGKILVAGKSGNTNSDFALARYHANGMPDNSFSGDGLHTTDFFGGPDQASTIVVQDDGKILVAGSAKSTSGRSALALARFHANAAPDLSFGGTGRFIDESIGTSVSARAIILQPDHRILATGYTQGVADSSLDLVVGRYQPEGSLDLTFDDDGKGTAFYTYSGNSRLHHIAVQQDGKLVVAEALFSLARYHADGTPDSTFGIHGQVVEAPIGEIQITQAIAIQQDEKLLLAGHDPAYDGSVLMRFQINGTLDSTFGNNGVVKTPSFSGNAIAIQDDGKILVAGGLTNPVFGTGDFAVIRLNKNGTMDDSFDGDGILITDFVNIRAAATAIAVQPDGHIAVVGSTINFPNFNLVLARYRSDGSLDPDFGIGGKQETDLFGSHDMAAALTIQKDEKIIVAGFSERKNTNRQNFTLVRFNKDGTLDSTFSKDGKLASPYNFNRDNRAGDIVLQEDGKIIVPVNFPSLDPPNGLIVFRFNPDGTPDSSFQENGMLRSYFGKQESARGVALAGNRLYVSGVQRQGLFMEGLIAAYMLEEAGMVVSSFTLIDAVRDTDAGELKDGAVVNLSAIRGTRISIRANTGGAAAGSVVMQLSGTQVHNRTENRAPYALFGNRNKEHTYRAWRPSPGPYTLTATPYAGTNGRGTKGTPYTVRFTIVEELSLARFTLINAARNTVISTLSDGAVIDLAHTPHINIRAEQGTGVAESIRFGVNDQAAYSMESSVPFALAGDIRGDYAEWQVSPGTYTITATPYSENYGRGTMGTALRITITIIDSKAEQRSGIVQGAAEQQQEEGRGLSLEVLPNPVKESGWVQFRVPQATTVALFLADGAGRSIQQVFGGRVQGGVLQRLKVQTQGLPPGLYFCRLVTAGGKTVTSKLVRQ
ncbi:hypothetical protein BUE76_00845 [Cnuella takakiae]|nr:hypothetical protein BUE76_00845 [Cnuella takakiae]